jgi:hypothetical protein
VEVGQPAEAERLAEAAQPAEAERLAEAAETEEARVGRQARAHRQTPVPIAWSQMPAASIRGVCLR